MAKTDGAQRLIVRLARAVKRDDTFSIDPGIGTVALGVFLLRRLAMALRGVCLSLGCGRAAFPVFVGRGVVVHNRRHLRLSRGVTIEDYVRLDCLGSTGIDLGTGVTLRRGVQIEVTSTLKELGVGCVIGARSGISEGCYLGAKGLLTIGGDTDLGPGCIIVAENHGFQDRSRPIREQQVTRVGVSIESNCWIGAGVRVLDGVTIGTGSVVGAGAVVTRSIPGYSIALGVPARVVRNR